MAPIDVIDLISDLEEDVEESPRKAVLAGFEPRKEKANGLIQNGHHYPRPGLTGVARPVPAVQRQLEQGQHSWISSRAGNAQNELNSPRATGNQRGHFSAQHDHERSMPPRSDRYSTLGQATSNGTSVLTDARAEVLRKERVHHFQEFHKKQAIQSRAKAYGSALSDATAQNKSKVTDSHPKAVTQLRPTASSVPAKTDSLSPSAIPLQAELRQEICIAMPPTSSNGLKRPAKAIENAPTPASDAKRMRKFVPETSTELVPRPSPKPTSRPVEAPLASAKQDPSPLPNGTSRNGQRFSLDEDLLLKKLKEDDGLSWDQIVTHFHGRTCGSLQVRYSTKLKNSVVGFRPDVKRKRASEPLASLRDDSPTLTQGRSKRERKSIQASGFVSWASVKQNNAEESSPRIVPKVPDEASFDLDARDATPASQQNDGLLRQDRTFTSSVSKILRQRELGHTTRRAWSSDRSRPAELVNHIFKDYRIQKQYHGTSGDVVTLSWSPDGSKFAAGSIAISDDRSMQYNMNRNLLLGNREELLELPDHHIPRPDIKEQSFATRESQDPRLFLTVTGTGFTADGKKLLTIGMDKKLRQYGFDKSLDRVKCRYEIEHPDPVTLLSVHVSNSIAATGCHSATESIRVFACRKTPTESILHRSNTQSQVSTFPSALKWGLAWQHQRMLLGGFSGDAEKEHAGETCLWEVETGKVIELHTVTRNVFDLAWNPSPSPASMAFVVASNPSSLNVSRGTRTVIQCFAPEQNEAKRVLAWESPAADINDVVICPHDENLIAAGATNGKVYIWDYRYVGRSQQPLHTLTHDRTENVLDHDRDIEEADTGVRFLSWGRSKDRLYSGSSDGVVKVWNPYRSAGNAFVDDIAAPTRQRSAIMSGAFSPDYRELLLGTENGRIDLFEAGGQAVYKVPTFKLRQAKVEDEPVDPYLGPRALLRSGQIAIRPAGAMPFRQAVQGPRYSGISLPDEVSQAQSEYLEALNVKDAAADEEQLIQANVVVDEAQARLTDLCKRHEHFVSALPKAQALQRSLASNEIQRERLLSRLPRSPSPCELDCKVLRGQEQDDEVEDSGRSSFRIPEVMRTVALNTALSSLPTEPDGRCFSCVPERKNIGKSCPKCTLQKQGLTAPCVSCSGPARVPTDGKPAVCEKCNFSCFRCGEPARLSPAMTRLTCAPCGFTWEMGVLGYEFATPLTFRPKKAEPPSAKYEIWNDFGSVEREHYAGLVEEN